MTAGVTTFLAVLAVLAHALLAVLALLVLAAIVFPGARRLARAAAAALAGTELTLAWVVAAVATAGSLYFSEVAHYTPCVLCWYQRIAMYPLVLVLAFAAVRRRNDVAALLLPLPVAGAAVAAYHYQLEWFPGQEEPFCSQGISCSVRWFLELGYVSLPLLALTAFVLIGGLLALAAWAPDRR